MLSGFQTQEQEKVIDKPIVKKAWKLLPSQEALIKEKVAQFDREMAKLITLFRSELQKYVYKDLPENVVLNMATFEFITQDSIKQPIKKEVPKE